MFKRVLILFIISISIFTCGNFALAENTLMSSISCINDGSCQLNDVLLLIKSASTIMLGFTGSVALLFFVYGGVMFLISAGSRDRVNKAKQIIVGSVIGIAIVFLSYTIIDFSFKILMGDNYKSGWNKSNWF